VGQVSELERLSGLIGFIYRGATDPSLWPEIVAEAGQWLGSPKGMLYTPLHGPEQGGVYFQHGLTDHFLELYKSRYQSVDMWTQQAVRLDLFKEGNVVLGTDLVPHQTLVGSQWYRDCLQVGGIARLLTSVVFGVSAWETDPRTADMPTACSFYRGDDAEDYSEVERRKLALLLPHFSRSLGVMARLRLKDLQVASTLSALERLPLAVVLMSRAGNALFANRSATAMLARTTLLRLERSRSGQGLGRLVARSPGVSREIEKALLTASRITDVLHFSSLIKVPSEQPGQGWSIQISRLGPANQFSAEGELPEIIAFLTDPDQPVRMATGLLCRTYGLTPAEERVAVAATAAGPLEELADTLLLRINTVKTHLRQVYAKTGVRGRAELVRLVLGLASPE
jgi:DNA-binding CsgD family transcriptional regulator